MLLSLILPAFPTMLFADTNRDLTQLSLEELMNVEITSVSKKPQKLSQAASAIYVITAEDIRRSTADSIPELLRMVPGLHVARIDASKWAISARGFNNRFANKLLVLLDGRTLYSPLFSGVYWDVQDTLLEDIERIEVIRGPGGTLWGANAVNGVINIITKNSKDTTGTLAAATVGSHKNALALRHGSQISESTSLRFYAKAFDHDDFKTASDDDAHDEWDMQRAGFRLDSQWSNNKLTLQGDIYNGDADQTIGFTSLTPPTTTSIEDEIDLEGGNILARWTQHVANGSEWSLLGYYDYTRRNDSGLKADISTYDLDFQYRLSPHDNHEITWGVGYRYTDFDLENSFTVSFDGEDQDNELFSAFIQDDVKLSHDITLTLGTKVENNDFSGTEWQPNARLLWNIHTNHSIWTAVSRAVRTPSPSDDNIRLNFAATPGAPPGLFSFLGDSRTDAENLLAFEVGYRGYPGKNLLLDITAFYNQYDDLISSEPNPVFLETNPLPPHLLFSSTFANGAKADSYGIELSSTYQVNHDWRLQLGYAYLNIDADNDSSSLDSTTAELLENTLASNILQLRSQYRFNSKLEWDTLLYYSDNISSRDIPSYTQVDMRLGWKAGANTDVDFIVRNIFDDRHPEFSAVDVSASEIPRTFSARVRWSW